MSEELWDFDAGWDEADAKPFRFKFLSKTWELPPDVPAETLLKLERNMVKLAQLEQSGAEELPDDFVIDESITAEGIARGLAGDEIVDQWLQLGCTYRQLMRMNQKLLAFYRGGNPMEDDKPGKPNRAERRAATKSAVKSKAPANARRKSGTGRR